MSYLFHPPRADWTPDSLTAAQRKALNRAMHSFVRKYPQFALAGGKGRKRLYLYEPSDPVSATWMKMQLESRSLVTWSAAREAMKSKP